MSGDERAWHALPAAEAVRALETDPERGLATSEARARLARHGPNALPEASRRSLVGVFLAQFQSPLIYLLLAAAVAALLLGEPNDAAVIALVVCLNALIGAFQEGRAERSLEALRRLSQAQARVLRDGHEAALEARAVVPGDVLLLSAGDAVAADARLLTTASLETAEAALTGESLPVGKETDPLPEETPLPDRRNMVYTGTHVASGRGRALVVATGPRSEIGRIAALAEAAVEPETPLAHRISVLGRWLMVAAAVLFVVVIVLGTLQGFPLRVVGMVAISQVVGLVPEGLPVAMTIALAVGVQRMAQRRAIVRRLAAVETLGSTDVVCSDKTGTLTRNEMTVTAVHLPGRGDLEVTGVGYGPEGEIRADGHALAGADDPDLALLLEAGVLCNDAELVAPHPEEPRWQVLGDPTEAALLVLAAKGGLAPDDLRMRSPRMAELPFDARAKLMATAHRDAGGMRVFVKGAPEVVLAQSGQVRAGGRSVPLLEPARARHREAGEALAARALRVLALALVEQGGLDLSAGFDGLAGRLTFLGFVGQLDPPRPEVADAVAACRRAGVRAVMVTGDHQATGFAVARMLGMAREGDAAVTGVELERMPDEALAGSLDRVAVFARVQPAQKLRIVGAFQSRGHVVAMTGDGVNDAPALARADVGVAMGVTGTEVAKQAARVVVTDDNFATIVAAVEEGRLVHRNLQKALLYLLSTSLAEVAVLLVALAAGYPPPLAAVQILWINLVTEGTVTVNLVMDPAEGDEMRRKPIPRNRPLFTRTMWRRLFVMTPSIALSTLGWFVWRLSEGLPFAQVQSETFTVLAVCQWFNVLSCRSDTRSVFQRGLRGNRWLLVALVVSNLLHALVIYAPPMNAVFHTIPIGVEQFFAIGVVASLVLWTEELRKLLVRRRRRR